MTDEINSAAFDMLLSLSDYVEFKESLLTYKKEYKTGQMGLVVDGVHQSSP